MERGFPVGFRQIPHQGFGQKFWGRVFLFPSGGWAKQPAAAGLFSLFRVPLPPRGPQPVPHPGYHFPSYFL